MQIRYPKKRKRKRRSRQTKLEWEFFDFCDFATRIGIPFSNRMILSVNKKK